MIQLRRGWTAISVAVLAATGWATLGRISGPVALSPPGLAFAFAALIAGLVWVRAQHTIRGIRRRLSVLSPSPASSQVWAGEVPERPSPPRLASPPQAA